MNNRISHVINLLGIKKVDFAERLGISAAYVSQVCSGDRTPSDRTISDICRIFNVDRAWLETGHGEPFRQQSRDEVIAEILTKAITSNSTAKDRLIRALCQLPDDLFPYAEQIIREICENLKKEAE